jgi:hypothetical protein
VIFFFGTLIWGVANKSNGENEYFPIIGPISNLQDSNNTNE